MISQRTHRGRVEPVDPTRPGRLFRHEPCRLQHLEVLRHRGTTDRQLVRQLTDRSWSLGQAFEDRPSRRIAERTPHLSRAIANSSLIVLPGVGHLCNLEDEDAFNAAVRTWLRNHT